MEEILKYIGNWGKYQVYIFCLLLFPMIMSGNITLISTFTMGVPNTRCYIPGYDNYSAINYNSPFNENLTEFLFASPKAQSSAQTYCSYCNLDQTLAKNTPCTSNIAMSCTDGYVYDTSQYKSSVTQLFNMVCGDVWKYELLQSLFSVGVLIGSAIFGYVGDRYGRRSSFLISGLSQIVVLNLVPISYNYYAYCFMQILAGGLQYAAYLSAFVVVMEMFGGFPKTFFGIWSHGFFAIGYFYVGLMAYLIRYWQYLYWSVALLSLLYIPYYWLFPESVRWLVINNRPKEAEKIVLKAAKWNGVIIPDEVLKRELYLVKDVPQVTVTELFKYKELGIITLIVFFTCCNASKINHLTLSIVSIMTNFIFLQNALLKEMVDSVCYYGLSWNIAWLPGNNYANFVLSGMTDLVSYVFCVPIMEYFGRRYTLVGFFFIGGISLIISGFVEQNKLVILFTLIGRFMIAANFGITYIYSVEVFPTVVRNSASGFSSVASRIGSIAAPQIALLSDYAAKWLPVVIYGSFAILAAVADWFLPETKGKPLKETVEEEIIFIRSLKQRKETVSPTMVVILPENNGEKF